MFFTTHLQGALQGFFTTCLQGDLQSLLRHFYRVFRKVFYNIFTGCFGKDLTSCFQCFYKDCTRLSFFLRFLQGFCKAFTRCLRCVLQGVHKAFTKSFTRLLQCVSHSFYNAFLHCLYNVCLRGFHIFVCC